MDYNINMLFIILGSMVVIISLYILLRYNESNYSEEYYSTPLDKDRLLRFENIMKSGNKKTIEEINNLSEEITRLKSILNKLESLIDEKPNDSFQPIDHSDTDDFKHLLNYNKFLNKNSDIINLLKQNNTPEEIAQKLNKSVREVEMVIKLVK